MGHSTLKQMLIYCICRDVMKEEAKEERDKISWDRLKKGFLKKETKNTIVATQDEPLRDRNMSNVVYGKNFNRSVVYVVLLMKQLHILCQDSQT